MSEIPRGKSTMNIYFQTPQSLHNKIENWNLDSGKNKSVFFFPCRLGGIHEKAVCIFLPLSNVFSELGLFSWCPFCKLNLHYVIPIPFTLVSEFDHGIWFGLAALNILGTNLNFLLVFFHQAYNCCSCLVGITNLFLLPNLNLALLCWFFFLKSQSR